MTDADPPRIPGYEFVRPLGRGGFSDVHLYQQRMPRRQVAIKVLRVDTLDQRQRQAFTAEANTMAQLADHPHIVPVLVADITADGRPFLVMTYYPGDDLAQRVSDRPLGLAEALRTGIQLACAVESAHRVHVLHRDIKPANVLMSRSGAPGLTDFGIAGNLQTLHEEEEFGLSIPWSAPEVLGGDSNGSVASDVYSLGATIWNLLVGRSPFKIPGGDNGQSAMVDRILRLPASPTGLGEVPPALDRLLLQCLSKDPALRPRSAHQLARDLQSIEVAHNLSRTELIVLDPELDAVATTIPEAAPSGPPTAAPTVAKGPVRISPMPVGPTSPPPEAQTVSAAAGAAETLHRRAAGADTTTEPVAPVTTGGPGAAQVLLVAGVVLAIAVIGFLLVSGGDDTGSADPGTDTGRRTQQVPGELLVPPPSAPDVADAVRRGRSWVLTWQEVSGAETYGYEEEGLAEFTDLGPTREIKVPANGPRRCFFVYALNNVGAKSDSPTRRCTPGGGS